MPNKLVEPNLQNIVSNPYFASKFEFGSASDSVRLCRYLNQIFNIFGKDVVIKGGTVSSTDLTDNIFSITFRDGRVIQDQTLIQFDSFTLDMDVSTLVPSDTIMVVFTRFKFSEADRDVDNDPNPFVFRLGALDKSTGNIYTETSSGSITTYSWDSEVNRIVMAAFPLDDITEPLDNVTINGVTYNSRGDIDSLVEPIDYDGGVIKSDTTSEEESFDHAQTISSYSLNPLQNVFFRPYTQRLHQTRVNEYNEDGSITTRNVRYIDEEFNRITKVIGSNIILKGLDIDSYSRSSTSLTVTIGPGELITDDTYIKIDESTTLTYDNLHAYDESGMILLISDFENENVVTKSKFRFRLIYIDSSGNSIDSFDLKKNRIVFAAFSFSKSGGSLDSVNLENLERVNINGTWTHDLETEFENNEDIKTRLLDILYLTNTSYDFSFSCYDCDESSEARLRFKSNKDTIDAIGNSTSSDDWIIQSGSVSIPERNKYNVIIYSEDFSQLRDFEISGLFPFDIRPKGDFEAELDGGFIE